jgi:hypothetical protein
MGNNILIVSTILNMACVLAYAIGGERNKAVYFFGAFLINFSLLFMK